MRFLIILAIIAFFIFLLRRLLFPPRQPGRNHAPQNPEPEKMVECAHCRLYLPQSEAVREQEQFFCSRDHYHRWQSRSQND